MNKLIQLSFRFVWQWCLVCFCLGLLAAKDKTFAQEPIPTVRERIRGMLIGSLYGDALGGPVEFKSNEDLAKWVPDLRSWNAKRFSEELNSGELSKRLVMHPYSKARPEIAPYGPWEARAAAGTVTDDSRHKMILMHCLTKSASTGTTAGVETLSRAYLEFPKLPTISTNPKYVQLSQESFSEYSKAARWLLGERDLKIAFPPQRLWAGIGTCSGQMALPPVAAVYPGDPGSAYRAAFALDFVDVGGAKDINCALVAALSSALGSTKPVASGRWEQAITAIRSTDPYRYSEVPFAKRPATEWLDFAMAASRRAKGKPSELFRILESEGRPKYYWDAHFTYTCSLAFLEFCDYRPKEALLVSLSFGHDTDSAAQVVGALSGAVHGESVFPASDLEQVRRRLEADYGMRVESWVDVLVKLHDRDKHPRPVKFLESP